MTFILHINLIFRKLIMTFRSYFGIKNIPTIKKNNVKLLVYFNIKTNLL